MEESDIRTFLLQRVLLYQTITDDSKFAKQIIMASKLIKATINFGGKILIFGNGGSAAQAQHFAAELVGKFERERPAIDALALTTDTSILTSVANDSGFGRVFSRQIEAYGKRGDLVIGLTTSDCKPNSSHSRNILNGFLVAKRKGLKSIGLFSQKTKHLLPFVDAPIVVPAKNTALIQEVHQTLMHLLCRFVEEIYE